MVRLSRDRAPHKRTFPLLIIVPLLLVVLSLVVFISCNDEPSGVQTGDTTNSGNTNIDPGLPGEFLLASVEDSDNAFGRIEIWGTNLTSNPDSGTVSFDAVLVNASDSPVYPPIRFVVTSLRPLGVSVVNPSGFDRAGDPFFDFSDKLGEDGVLAPGERSRPFTFVFYTGAPGSFVIGYRFDFAWHPGGRSIVGVVFNDLNGNGFRERCEPGIPGVAVMLDSRSPDGGGIHLKLMTDENGGFRFDGLAEGIYNVGSAMPPGLRPTTPNPVLVTLTGSQENLVAVIFGFYNPVMPPAEQTLFGPLYVGPGSPVGAELDSTFFAPLDSLDSASVPPPSLFYLEVAYPPIMAPYLDMYDSAMVAINGETVYHFIYTGDPTFRDPIPGVFLLPDSLVHYGRNDIYIRVNGDEHAMLQFRVFSSYAWREDC